MTPLYSLRTEIDHDSASHYRITKFVDGEVESSYLVGHDACECPAGHRHTCRHRQMLPQMLAHGIANTHWFFAFDMGGAIVDFNGTPKRLFDELAAIPGVQVMGLDDIGAVHNAIADAVGEPREDIQTKNDLHALRYQGGEKKLDQHCPQDTLPDLKPLTVFPQCTKPWRRL